MKKIRLTLLTAVAVVAFSGLFTSCEDKDFDELSTDIELMDVESTDDEEGEDAHPTTGG